MYYDPMDLEPGDQITITDEGQKWQETVEALPTLRGDKVQVWTDKRLLHLDANVKVSARKPMK